MKNRFTVDQAAKAEADARKRGQPHLADMFRRMRVALSSKPPKKTKPGERPRLCLLFNNKTWCDGRLSAELANHLSWDYQCRLVDKSDANFFRYEDDLYLFRNVGRISVTPPPQWAERRTICMLESERPLLQYNYIQRYSRVEMIVAQNLKLRDMARAKGIDNVINAVIGNGINTDEFSPAPELPEEFTVGASGNFSRAEFDEWKGFGRYIVPACRLAKVKLSWCSWEGKAHSLPGIKGEQVPLDHMNDWYRGLSCLVAMSRSEGCSGVTFEAMASGLPVVSTRVGWHGEKCDSEIMWVNRPAEPGPHADTVAIEELAHRILWLKNHPGAAKAIGARARKFAEGWTHQRVAGQWRQIFAHLLK